MRLSFRTIEHMPATKEYPAKGNSASYTDTRPEKKHEKRLFVAQGLAKNRVLVQWRWVPPEGHKDFRKEGIPGKET